MRCRVHQQERDEGVNVHIRLAQRVEHGAVHKGCVGQDVQAVREEVDVLLAKVGLGPQASQYDLQAVGVLPRGHVLCLHTDSG